MVERDGQIEKARERQKTEERVREREKEREVVRKSTEWSWKGEATEMKEMNIL